jgi:hypothetical protein
MIGLLRKPRRPRRRNDQAATTIKPAPEGTKKGGTNV